MKQLIIFILMMGLANVAFARTDDAKNSADHRVVNDIANYEAPYYESLSGGETELKKLRNLICGKEYKDSKMQYKGSILSPETNCPVSKFQLIVDEGGNIIDCTLLKSTDLNKDNLVLKFFPSSKFFISPGTLNGQPCKSIVIVSIGYYQPGSMYFDMDSYPVMNLTDSEMDTASADSAPKN